MEVVRALREAGIRSLLLKGPTLQFLYGDTSRTYVDSDLLVSVSEIESAEQVLIQLGFETPPLLPKDRPWVARPWVRDRDQIMLELHRTFEGIEATPDRAWTVLIRSTSSIELRGETVEALSLAGRVLLIALHALEHRSQPMKPIEDLERALKEIGTDTWADAAGLADEIDALPAFIGGLSKTPSSTPILEALNLEQPTSLGVALRQADVPPMAVGINWLMNRPGFSSKFSLVLRKLFPSPSYIRSWFPRAKGNVLWLAAAYAWRPIWLIGNGVPAFLAWRRVKVGSNDLAQSRYADKT